MSEKKWVDRFRSWDAQMQLSHPPATWPLPLDQMSVQLGEQIEDSLWGAAPAAFTMMFTSKSGSLEFVSFWQIFLLG